MESGKELQFCCFFFWGGGGYHVNMCVFFAEGLMFQVVLNMFQAVCFFFGGVKFQQQIPVQTFWARLTVQL